MKIIGISSGLSYTGYTANLIRVALQTAANQGALVEEIFIPDYEVRICKGCCSCLAKGKCGINDDLELLRQKLSQADGIIIGSQAFGGEPDPAMQNFLNRIGFYNQYTGFLADKYILTIATTETFDAVRAAKKLAYLTSSYFKDGYVSGVLGFNVSWERIEHYPEYLGKIESLTIKLVNDLQRKRRFQLRGCWRRLGNRLFRVPEVKKLILAHRNGKMEAVYRELRSKGWLGEPVYDPTGTKANITATARS
ncbi:MAG: flavodoxin family protein [Firmicutes bacterium]|nr:flavodoxin family protein [Bacillota bacterium]